MTCENCPFKGSPRVPPSGPIDAKYVLVGEAPGHYEVKQGKPFVGETGRLLDAFLARGGINRSDCYFTNALQCQIPRGTDKKSAKVRRAVTCCRDRLFEELDQTVGTIALMGAIARQAVFPHEQGGVLASRGWRTADGRDLYIMAHPAYYLYNPNEAPMLTKDLKRLKRGRQEPIGPFTVAYWVKASAFPELDGSVLIRGAEWMSEKGPVPDGTSYIAYVLRRKEQLQKLLAHLHSIPMEERGYIAFDLETDQVDFQRDRILCMSISIEPGTAYIIPDSLLYQDGHTFITTGRSKLWWKAFLSDERYLTGEYLRPNWGTVAMLTEMFAIPGYTWVGHLMKFDLRFLVGQLGVNPPVSMFDTIVAHYTLDERLGCHKLKGVSDDYFDSGNYEADLFDYIPKKSGRFSAIPRDILYRYNAMDTELTLRLAHVLTKEMKEQGLFELPFLHPMMNAIPMLLQAELKGVFIDWEETNRIELEELQPELAILKEKLQEISEHPDLNPLSSQQVNNIIYDELDFPIIEVRTRAAGKRIKKRSSQKAVVDGWRKMWENGQLSVTEHAWSFVETLAQYRHLRKLQGSYIWKWQKFHGIDDRVHTSYQLRGTVTGRLSATDPPVQTIPSKVSDKWGPLVANIHIPPEGFSFLYADYSQAELMALACLSDDEFMLDAFRRGEDYHNVVASAAFGENFTRDERQASKRLTFGWAYGGNVFEIAMNALQFEGNVAKRFATEWDKLFFKAVAWRKAQGELMIKQGYVESLLGRRRRYALLTSKNVGKAKRVAINAPIQSIISDLLLISATRLYEHYKNDKDINVILLIHDSCVLEAPNERVEEVKAVMERILLEVAAEIFKQIPFRADVKVGTRLGDLT